ncbi:Zinc finger, C2H2-like, Zinc finger, double-stranded RNA binding protein [Heracleum sosnowskyi]|uniref:Zinc finger, C2H2-like, Zinc finger, double-stranded RNA binding protein n=1 Tax=Heracleum sosnowskyi TaxID=360622 RepID=A0AAD8NF08_9APIA|nr:Zinc finger, C2H2-like, Zinc finger, double-stranded RNA binding protein [Heracleum sosnowskyi]
MVEVENSCAASAEASVCSSPTEPSSMLPPPLPPIKKKRNLPGMPDPDAEVIALSPKTLQATNRFVCEICSKGFQRDQNLQLHRRGHNLPWKLKQRSSTEIKKRVYVCPEPSCVHHDPSRALGDLTGIKKHFSRKHGEKKWKCERCLKKYAVHSDWKAHVKTCGSREYRCDCGTLFSRRDSFITHRAFCDILAQEAAKSQPAEIGEDDDALKDEAGPLLDPPPLPSSPLPPNTPTTGVLSPVLSIQSSEVQENPSGVLQPPPPPATTSASGSSTTSSGKVRNSSGVFASIFASSKAAPVVVSQSPQPPPLYTDSLCAISGSDPTPSEFISLSLSSSLYFSSTSSPLFPASSQCQYKASTQPALSATALLQKAAQMGSTSSSSSFLRGLGLSISSGPTDPQDDMMTSPATQWNGGTTMNESNNHPLAADLGLGFSSDTRGSHLTNLMLQPTTLDLLGLGIGGGGALSSNGYSSFYSSLRGGLDAPYGDLNSTGENWDDASDRKPAFL